MALPLPLSFRDDQPLTLGPVVKKPAPMTEADKKRSDMLRFENGDATLSRANSLEMFVAKCGENVNRGYDSPYGDWPRLDIDLSFIPASDEEAAVEFARELTETQKWQKALGMKYK